MFAMQRNVTVSPAGHVAEQVFIKVVKNCLGSIICMVMIFNDVEAMSDFHFYRKHSFKSVSKT